MKKIYGWNYYIENILNSSEENIKKALEEKNECYHTFERPKKGGVRVIDGIDKTKELYRLQNNLYKNFLSRIPVSLPAKGFINGLGYQDFLRPHCGKKYYLRLDIRHFFDSITKEQVKAGLEEFVQDEPSVKNMIIQSMMDICLLNDHVPQGAVTSPALSNIIFRRIDQRILKYCQALRVIRDSSGRHEENIIYTRYADDMLFSSDFLDFRTQPRLYRKIGYILRENGFSLNREKVCSMEGQISLSGFVIGEDVHLSRKKLKDLNCLLHYFDKRIQINGSQYEVDLDKVQDEKVLEKVNQLFVYWDDDGKWSFRKYFDYKLSLINYLCGYRAFLIEFLKVESAETAALEQMKKKIRHIELLIKACQKNWFGITTMDEE